MQNEIIFIVQILFIFSCTLFIVRYEKSLLIAFVTLQAVLSNMFVVKQIDLFTLGSTGAEIFIVGSMLGITLLQEYYGEKISKQATYISFAGSIFYMIATQFHLAYQPSVFDNMHDSFEQIFRLAPRIVLSSVIVYFLAQRLNIFIYKLLSKVDKLTHSIIYKSLISMSIAQIFDTILFTFLALYGVVNSVVTVMCVSITIKIIILLMSVPIIKFSKGYLRNK